jgi:hypothetical protein
MTHEIAIASKLLLSISSPNKQARHQEHDRARFCCRKPLLKAWTTDKSVALLTTLDWTHCRLSWLR